MTRLSQYIVPPNVKIKMNHSPLSSLPALFDAAPLDVIKPSLVKILLNSLFLVGTNTVDTETENLVFTHKCNINLYWANSQNIINLTTQSQPALKINRSFHIEVSGGSIHYLGIKGGSNVQITDLCKICIYPVDVSYIDSWPVQHRVWFFIVFKCLLS